MKRAALLSVSNREGLVEFAKQLRAKGFELLTTRGTGRCLADEGINSVSIEDYTGQKEILGGRVKTLHPKIHAGVLARRDVPQDIAELEQEGIYAIDVVVVNLYPFLERLRSETSSDPAQMVEFIDIGGPTLIRAAAKNFQHIFPVIDPVDYEQVLEHVTDNGNTEGSLELRLSLARKVFANLAAYNLEIAKYFSAVDVSQKTSSLMFQAGDVDELILSQYSGMVLEEAQQLRYGENPHQKGKFFRTLGSSEHAPWRQIGGKELSFNNFLDFDAAFRMMQGMGVDRPSALIVKHLNPCGAAVAQDSVSALQQAKRGDPRSHFGGIIALNQEVSVELAQEIVADFAEIVIAPGFQPAALEILKQKKNLRIIEIDLKGRVRFEARSLQTGVLIQECDRKEVDFSRAELVSEREASEQEQLDLSFVWGLCCHVKSNAIVLGHEQKLIGVGAGQMSRIDSAEVAIWKAETHGHNLTGAVAASDAFFPFPDCIELFAEKGIMAVVTPGGARRDDEIISKANDLGVSLYFASERHFRH